jgi:hypothetical protein
MTMGHGLLAAIMLCALASPPALARDSVVGTWSYDAGLIPETLVLSLHNTGPTAVCVPRIDVDGERLILSQRGREIDPRVSFNRAVLWWRNSDLIGGMLVLPPGKRVRLFYNLRDWQIVSGLTDAALEVPTIDCSTFFRVRHPKFARRHFRYRFDLKLPEAEADK